MEARAVRTPSTSTINGLRATRGRAGLIVVAVWASITVVSSIGAILVVPAPLVLVVTSVMVTGAIRTPSSNTVHWLRATRSRTGLVVVGVWATIAIVGSALAVLVVPASLVAATALEARSVRSPRSHTVHRLGTTACGTRVLTVTMRAAVTIVGWMSTVDVLPATPVLMG